MWRVDVWLQLKIATGLDPPKTDLATRNTENSNKTKETGGLLFWKWRITANHRRTMQTSNCSSCIFMVLIFNSLMLNVIYPDGDKLHIITLLHEAAAGSRVKLKHGNIWDPNRALMVWGLQCVSSLCGPPPLCQWSKYKYIMSPLTSGSSPSGSQRDPQPTLRSVDAQQR